MTHTYSAADLEAVKILSRVTQETVTQENIKTTSTVIKNVYEYPEQGLMMRNLDLDSANIILNYDGSFGGNKDA